MKCGDTSWGVEPSPAAPLSAVGMTPALMPRYVFEKFGIPAAQIESLRDRLLAFMKVGQVTQSAPSSQ
jgi:hypothetical protein